MIMKSSDNKNKIMQSIFNDVSGKSVRKLSMIIIYIFVKIVTCGNDQMTSR